MNPAHLGVRDFVHLPSQPTRKQQGAYRERLQNGVHGAVRSGLEAQLQGDRIATAITDSRGRRIDFGYHSKQIQKEIGQVDAGSRYCQSWCPRADRGRFSVGEFLLIRRIVVRRSSVLEGDTLQEQFDVFGTVDAALGFLGLLDQLEGRAKEGRSVTRNCVCASCDDARSRRLIRSH
ncbi:hypothetical protein D3C72_1133700 [compost metagenome]